MVQVMGTSLVKGKAAYLPEMPSSALNKRLESLLLMKDKGKDVRLLFVACREDAEFFTPNYEADPYFIKLLLLLDNAGVPIECLRCRVDAEGMKRLYYQSDALVLATRNESQGLVIAEAMSTGIPAISTQGLPKSMQLDAGFRYVPVGDAEALMKEMQKAVGRPVTEEEGRHLAELVERRFAPSVIGAQIAEVMTGTWPRS